MMKCIRCQKSIRIDENYIQILEWNKNLVIKTNYCHKSCWVEMMEAKKGIRQGMDMINQLKRFAKERGMIKDEEPMEVVIQ